ncbi:hypothetical protein Mapa_002870 [Marchantia paleacea]|nr:hypothetical protein Mapa_002870 [Marchantia paleacea]
MLETANMLRLHMATRYCQILLEKNIGVQLQWNAQCIGSPRTLSCLRKRIVACDVRIQGSCRRRGQSVSKDKVRSGCRFQEQRWRLLKEAGFVKCHISREAMRSCQSSGEEESSSGENVYPEESNRDNSCDLPEEFGFKSSDWKSWFRSVCSTVLALTICVPQALGAGAVLGDLALINCETPEIDYGPLKGLEGATLKEKLHDLIKDHTVYSYIQVWDALKVLDQATDDPNSVIDIYSLQKMPKSAQGSTTGWNREHLWPRSFGLIDGQPGFTDLHNLRPSDANVNSSRGNKVFGDCSTQAVQCLIPANNEAAPDTGANKDIWMPPSQVRGDIARAVFYMAVRYGSEQPVGVKELRLSNSPDVESEVMGLLKDLVRWNELDPPSDSERERNNKVCSLYQRNRNPFVDHPEFVKAIWGDGSELSPDTPDTPDTPEPPSPSASDINAWINELHYDNAGADVDEFIEVVMGRDVDPTNLKVVLYNGGKEYRSLSMGDSKVFSKVDNISDGFSLYVARFPSALLQNGPGDGLALVDEGKTSVQVIQTLSYEGSYKAVDGPANGQESVDIGVEEGSNTPVGSSLGLMGTGNKYGDFKWSIYRLGASPGALNPGQILSAPALK